MNVLHRSCLINYIYRLPAFQKPSRTALSLRRSSCSFRRPCTGKRTVIGSKKNEQGDDIDRSGEPEAVVLAASASSSQPSERPWQWEESENALATYTIFFGLLALGQLPLLQSVKFVELPYFLGLACLTIYIGAHRGLTCKVRQQIGLKQGALAPLAASAALFGGFLLVKYLPWVNLQTVCNAYFWIIGSAAVIGALGPPLRRAAGPFGETSLGVGIPDGLLLDEAGKSVRHAEFAPSDLLAVSVGLAAATLDIAAGHRNFTFNNLLACLICCDILQLIGLRSFRAAAVLLFGLLAYDVFWVFGSPKVIGENVMLTVATSDILTGPTRLLFPRASGSVGEAASFPFSLLGLGDVAVPGLLACLALRFDSFKMRGADEICARADAAAAAFDSAIASAKPDSTTKETAHAAADAASAAYDEAGGEGEPSSAPLRAGEEILKRRPYFVTTMVAYVGGLGLAFGFNAVTHMGQPALLYLVPCCLGGVALIAAARGDLQRAINFTDATPTTLLQDVGKGQSE